MKELTSEEFNRVADKYVEALAARKKISKCEAASTMLQGLLFIEEMLPLRPDLKGLFRAVEIEVIEKFGDYTCQVCTERRER